MAYITSILLSILLSFPQAYGHGDEKHEASEQKKEIELDENGFETLPKGPSKIILSKINDVYLESVKNIFEKKCLSCHGINNSLPWYYNVPGAKQLMNYDMKESKKHMDMSNDFPFMGHGSPADDLNALAKTIKKGNMPPLRYKLLHWNSELTEDEINIVAKWLTEALEALKNSDK